MPLFLKRADKILTVSEFTKQDIIRHFNIDNRKITVCHNGCRSEFKPLPTPKDFFDSKNLYTVQRTPFGEGGPFFLYVGAVHPRKNVHRLIEAFDAFKKETLSDIQLIICGRFGWLTGEVKTAFEKAAHKEDIIFTGYLADEEVVKLTAAALAFVYVSNFEGFGIPILEAMNCDVPVITSNTSSMPEVAGDAALLVNPESVADIAAALKKIAFDENLRLDLIEKGRLQRAQFSWDKSADIVYQNILQIIKTTL